MDKMDRVVVVPKEFYSDLAVLLHPQERMLGEPPIHAWESRQQEQVDPRFSMGIMLVAPTPEGPRYLWFMREVEQV